MSISVVILIFQEKFVMLKYLLLVGACKDDGKTYALYTINVYRASSEGTKSWTVFRRYSDFDDLHLHLKEKVSHLL